MPRDPLVRPDVILADRLRPAPAVVVRPIAQAAPFLLLPLRLEYRYFAPGSSETFAQIAKPPERSARTIGRVAAERGGAVAARASLMKSDLRFAARTLAKAELWVRWYPDDVFAMSPRVDATASELAALASLDAVINARPAGQRNWWDLGDEASRDAWQRFVATVGFARAIYLERTRGTLLDKSAAAIFGLPERIELYALSGATLTLLGTGAPIAQPLTYEVETLGPAQWLTDFNQAVEVGMGMRLSGGAVEQALAADWLIACGLGAEAHAALEGFLTAAADRGELEFVRQDSATNNSSKARTPLVSAVDDPVTALPYATFLERRSAADTGVDADRLADAFGIDPSALYRAAGAGNVDGIAAEAALIALLPGLTHAFGQLLEQEQVDPMAFRTFLARNCSARGPLPVLRIGHSPYGILPITPLPVGAPTRAAASDVAGFAFANRFVAATIETLRTSTARAQIPVARASDPARQDVLRQILQRTAVSLAVSASEAGRTPQARPVTCPLVEAPSAERAQRAASYLAALTRTPLASLPNPDRSDSAWPLLYRLLRLSLELLLHDAPATVRALSLRDASIAVTGETPAFAQQLRAWLSALETLARQSPAQLEMLMLEVLDLLDHRIDAWATGVAYARLSAQRDTGDHRTRVGYYGMLEGPRAKTTAFETDGYVQAPSLAQAVTSGLLRSAAIRQAKSGPFQIDLSSRRARKARKSLDLLRKGLELREILGMHAERWLHDHGEDALLYELRQRFPVKRGGDATTHAYPLIDGELVLAPASRVTTTVAPARRSAAKALLAELAEQKDALADLVVAEAVHQLASGQLGAVNAWMNVLTGGTAPVDLDFLPTPRAGHSSSHRVAFLSAPAAYAGGNPRRIAEPLLGDLAATLLPGFATARVRAQVTDGRSPALVTQTLDLALDTDLGLEPIDVVCAPTGELLARTRAVVINRWRTDGMLTAKFGPLPDQGLSVFLERTRPLTFDLDYRAGAGASVNELLATAATLRDLSARSRGLTPLDLNAGSPAAETGLDAATQVIALTASISVLRGRADRLRTLLDGLRAQLRSRSSAVLVAAREIRRKDGLAQPPLPPERVLAIAALAALRGDLETTLGAISFFGVVEALTPIADGDVIVTPEQLEVAVNTILTRLTAKLSELMTAIADADALAAAAPRDARAVEAKLIAALRSACDIGALAIWPPFPLGPNTTPVVGGPTTLAAAIGDWERIRPQLRAARVLATAIPALRVRSTAETNTADARRPAVSYYGVHLLPTGDLPANEAAGFVIDEWTEVRPSSIQTTGLAIDHDTPRSEPPHVLLLGVPPQDLAPDWTGAAVAGVVRGALELMSLRALPARDATYRTAGLHAFNLVPPSSAPPARARIPTDARSKLGRGELAFDFELVDTIPTTAATVHGRIERTREPN